MSSGEPEAVQNSGLQEPAVILQVAPRMIDEIAPQVPIAPKELKHVEEQERVVVQATAPAHEALPSEEV